MTSQLIDDLVICLFFVDWLVISLLISVLFSIWVNCNCFGSKMKKKTTMTKKKPNNLHDQSFAISTNILAGW